jgi:7,8-dihydro-6-hydroxymethylpterin-pyrophosphokinase
LAAKEIEKFYNLDIATDAERVFFDTALKKYQSTVDSNMPMQKKFMNHIAEIETKYHPDQLGNFARLWPELHTALNTH